jgi:pentapeptide MXKDX repeat protein
VEPEPPGSVEARRCKNNLEVHLMRKLIATAAVTFLSSAFLSLAPLSSTAFAQDKAGAPAAKSGDTMSKGDDMSKDKMSKKTAKKAKKPSKMKSDDAMKQ